MANVIQPSAKKQFADGGINLLSDTIKVILIDSADYTYNASHAFLSDVPAAARVATATLASKTTTGGVFDAADAVFSSATGDASEALWIVKDTGTESTSPLITYFDTVSGLPITPAGANITVEWNASGIFAI